MNLCKKKFILGLLDRSSHLREVLALGEVVENIFKLINEFFVPNLTSLSTFYVALPIKGDDESHRIW